MASNIFETDLGKNPANFQQLTPLTFLERAANVSPYDIEESPSTGIFSGRPTARSNVANFMTRLIDNAELWNIWKFRMPVIMNSKK